MTKRIMSFVLCCCIILAGSTQVFAAETDTIVVSQGYFSVVPYMDYIAQAKGNIYIDATGNATVNCSVYGYQGTTTRVEISANLQQLQRGKWVTLKTYTAESDSHRTSLSESYSISKGYSYRVQATIKAYSGNKLEAQTVTSSEATY